MRIAHIHGTDNQTITRFAADLCRHAAAAGHKALLCCGYDPVPGDIPCLRIGETLLSPMEYRAARNPLRRGIGSLLARGRSIGAAAGRLMHRGFSLVTDRCGFYSSHTTRHFLRQLDKFQPDLVHLHSLHGCCLNVPLVIDYLRERDIPVVWTLHDNWAYTGHCVRNSYPIKPYLRPQDAPDASLPAICTQWQKGCESCPMKHTHPASYVLDQCNKNYLEKWTLFTSLRRLALATPSRCRSNEVKQSFLSAYPVHTLPGMVNLRIFIPCGDEQTMQRTVERYHLDLLEDRRLVLCAADRWDGQNSLDDLKALAKVLGSEYCVAATGLTGRQIRSLPEGMLGMPAVTDPAEMCALYTAADLVLCTDPLSAARLPEAMACGTQVLCYDTAALPEYITSRCGAAVPPGDIAAAAHTVRKLCTVPKDPLACMEQAAQYRSERCCEGYLALYRRMTGR